MKKMALSYCSEGKIFLSSSLWRGSWLGPWEAVSGFGVRQSLVLILFCHSHCDLGQAHLLLSNL